MGTEPTQECAVCMMPVMLVLRGAPWWYCVVLRDAAWCCVVLRGAAWCSVVLGGAAWCCVMLRDAYI